MIKNILIKRDGREQPYTRKKMKNVCMWASNNEHITDVLLKDTEEKLRPKMKITELYDSLITTAVSKISMLNPTYEFTAAKLLLLKLYVEGYGVKDKKYPHLEEVIKKGKASNIYDRDIMNSFSDSDLKELNNMIEQDRDYQFTYNALLQFDGKYCKNYSKTKKLELPQHTYMRVAMGICYNMPNRMIMIRQLYDIISLHYITLATPIMMNAGTRLRNLSSCILNTIGNDTHDILNKLMTAGIYTKYRGGVAFDVSHIQAKGGYTKNGVGVSGIVPYIKNIQEVIGSFVQGDTRRGAAVITCAWWHMEIEDFIVLKDPTSGTDENRALHLQYSIAENDLFIRRMAKNEDITLFDPVDVPDLLNTHGMEFDRLYLQYEQKVGIRKTIISAKGLWRKALTYRFQTGNLYKTFLDNINNANMTNRYIGSSNLCQEILEPSRAGNYLGEKIVIIDGKTHYEMHWEDEEIALCNLASLNLKVILEKMPRYHWRDVIQIMVKVMDNTISIADYPRAAAKLPNEQNRYLGLGVSNQAYYFAKKGILMGSKESEIETFKLFQDISAEIICASSDLAKELGSAPNYRTSKWSEGILPIDLANKELLEEFSEYYDHKLWGYTRNKVKTQGIRNILLMAIAPTASSATAVNATESIEPILDFSYRFEGAVSANVVVPEFSKLNQYYVKAYDIDQFALMKLAGIRQMFLDQSQSINMYIAEENWDYDYLTKLHLYAWKLGVKTLYYLNTPKLDITNTCESCS